MGLLHAGSEKRVAVCREVAAQFRDLFPALVDCLSRSCVHATMILLNIAQIRTLPQSEIR